VTINDNTSPTAKANLPSIRFFVIGLATTSVLVLAAGPAQAYDALLNSWLTLGSAQYARVYTTEANRTNGTSVTTWSIVEGTYVLQASGDLQSWTNLTGSVIATNQVAGKTDIVTAGNSKLFYRTQRTAVAAFDP
jgi:hypothetical protein